MLNFKLKKDFFLRGKLSINKSTKKQITGAKRLQQPTTKLKHKNPLKTNNYQQTTKKWHTR